MGIFLSGKHSKTGVHLLAGAKWWVVRRPEYSCARVGGLGLVYDCAAANVAVASLK